MTSSRSGLTFFAIAVFCSPNYIHAAGAGAPPPTPVIVENVTKARVADTLEALGTLRAKESVAITAKVADTVSGVRFEDGQTVTAGDVLIEQTDAEEAALLQEAESLAEEAKAQFKRFERLVAQGSASESLLDERRQTWRTASAREDAVRSRLKDRLITAPFSGRVGLRLVSPGALVSPGDIITTLVDDSSMKLDFTIPAIYLETVRVGTTIDATTPVYPERHFIGKVSSIDSTIDPATRSITIRAEMPNNDGILVPGMLMTLELRRNPRDAVVVSEETIIPRGNETHVLVVDKTVEPYVAERRKVVLGRRFAGKVEIRTGLEEGEMIISHGTLKVRPGGPIRILAIDDKTRSIAEMIRSEPASNG
jgi:membrane fusion protein (multidrug efflux system)